MDAQRKFMGNEQKYFNETKTKPKHWSELSAKAKKVRGVSSSKVYLDYIVYNMSEVFSIRIPRELKGMMREVEVDWASFVRGAVEEKVREEKRKNAMKLMDESRRKTRGVKFDSVEVVRALRNER